MAEFVLVLNVSKMASSVINRREYMKYIRASHPKVFISSPQIYSVASVCLSELLVRANGDSAPSKAKCLKITEKVAFNNASEASYVYI